MQQVDFFALTRGVQDRVLSSCRGQFDPKPILFRRATQKRGLAWLMLAPVSLVGLWLLFRTGLGDMQSPLGRHPTAYIAAYVGLVVAFAIGVVEWAAHRAATAALPFVPGFYLFPACLIDARSTKLGVMAIGELTSASIAGSHVVATFGSKTFRFPVDAEFQKTALDAIKLAQMQCKDGLEDAARVMLDPLAPPTVVGPFAPERPLVERRPLWVRVRLVAALLLGIVGVILYQERDRRSDEAMFASAKAQDDIAGYQLYLQHGSAHVSTVERRLLPAAELRIAAAENTVEAIDAFKARYPDTDIGAEVEAARRRALDLAFAAAKKPGTFEALLAFDSTYPGHHLDKEVAAARHAIYSRALAGYIAKMPAAAKTKAVAEALIAYAEKIGPMITADGPRGAFVNVAMRAVPSNALAKADDLVERNPYFVGPRSRPSSYLAPDKLQGFEDEVAKRYRDALAAGFPESVLRFRVGDDMPGGEELGAVTEPTLVVSYRVEPSGANYASAKPRGIYVGLVFFFRIDFLMPGGTPTHDLKHLFNVRVPGRLVIAHAKKPEGNLEAKIYDDMTRAAFDDLYARYVAEWFQKEWLDK